MLTHSQHISLLSSPPAGPKIELVDQVTCQLLQAKIELVRSLANVTGSPHSFLLIIPWFCSSQAKAGHPHPQSKNSHYSAVCLMLMHVGKVTALLTLNREFGCRTFKCFGLCAHLTSSMHFSLFSWHVQPSGHVLISLL